MKYVLSLSGGVDSTTLLAFLLDKGYEVEGVSFDYGSKHGSYEQESAQKIANWYDIPLHQIPMKPIFASFRSNLLQSGGNIPEGHYTDASMSQTIVPGRNIIFLSVIAGLAWSIGARRIALGIHQGDHAIYPDCRPDFYKAMELAILKGTDGNVSFDAPFLLMDKGFIVQLGLQLKVPYNLTRTCYKDQLLACGKCGSCVERIEAFMLNGVIDPIDYEVV